jgi:hypothetical protein
MPVQIDTIPTQQPFRIWFNALTPETSVSQPPTGLQHETGNNTSCWQRGVDGLFLAPPDAIVPYPSPMPFRPDFTDTQRAGEGLLRPFRFAPGGHVKFGANHIVFGIGGDVSVQPLVIAGPFANTATFTSSGHEELVVTLRRCPGTARC